MAKVIVMIPPDGGSPIVKVEGHAGPGCKAFSEKVTRKLGAVTSDQDTPEMYEQPLGLTQRALETE